MSKTNYLWTDNPTVSGVSICDTDILNDCLMHLKYDNQNSSIPLFTTIYTDYLLTYEQSEGWALQGTYVYKESASLRYGYPDFYNKCIDEMNSAFTQELSFNEKVITIYANANGHKFYDIADKDVIDEWYETYGIADFYGVDTENERIFLPRNKHFIQLTDDTSKVNDMLEAGLPNITGSTILAADIENNTFSGVFGPSTIYNGELFDRSSGGGWGVQRIVDFNASRSNSTYGKSNTVQPQASLKLLYYCVGNTSSLSAITDVTQITTSENDTLPLFHNFYSQEDMTSTGAYVNASLGSWLSGNVYETAYNELVNKIGTDNVKAVTDAYTDYDFVVNQDDMTFRLPLLNGEESLPSDKFTIENNFTVTNSLTEVFTAPANGWYMVRELQTMAGTLELWKNGKIVDDLFGMSTDNLNIVPYLKVYCKKGDVVSAISNSGTYQILETKFIYAIGNGNLYYKVANAVTNLELLNAGEVLNAVNSLIPDNSSLIAGYAMPSSKYIDLTLGASGSIYTAPANGYITLTATTTTQNGSIQLRSSLTTFVRVPYANGNSGVFLPCKKGDIVTLYYDGTLTVEQFRFIYAQGSESEV